MTFNFFEPKQALNHKTQRSVKRYSRLVKILRLSIPLGIVTALGCLFIHYGHQNAFSPEVTDKTRGQIHIENRLIRPTLMARDASGQPIIIRAEKAVQHEGYALLEQPESQLNIQTDRSLTIRSSQATYNKQKEVLTYQKNVKMEIEGLSLNTQEAIVDLEKKIATGNQPIKGQGTQGKLEAEGFKWQDGMLALKGKSKLVFN